MQHTDPSHHAGPRVQACGAGSLHSPAMGAVLISASTVMVALNALLLKVQR